MTRADLNVLDLVPVTAKSSAREAIADSVAQARAAEAAGYRRYWLAEHHNFSGIASSSTAVLIDHIAGATSTMRVGSGGIMLPNHAPLVVAEAFGTLAAIHGDRIDLGLGRAPGTDPMTARALRRDESRAHDFAADVADLAAYLGERDPARPVRAIPGEGTHVPLWVLGSSHGGATVAASMGLPYSFASHFAPAQLRSAITVYRDRFSPAGTSRASSTHAALERPRVMAGVNVMIADTDEQARRLFTSVQLRALGIVTGQPIGLREPVDPDELGARMGARGRVLVDQMLSVSFVGTASRVADELADFAGELALDEVIVTCAAYDPADRVRTLERLADAWR